MHRRAIIAGIAGLGLPRPALATPRRVILLGTGAKTDATSVSLLRFIREGLAEQGLVEGVDVHLEDRWAAGDYSAFAMLAAEVVASRPAVILVSTITAARAVLAATRDVPVVMLPINDPVAVGLVPSLARPGGNITGMATNTAEIVPKLIDLLLEVKPRLHSLAAISNPLNPSNRRMDAILAERAQQLGVASWVVPWSRPGDAATASAALRARPPGAVVVLPDAGLFDQVAVISQVGLDLRLPMAAAIRTFVDAGCLLSYGFPHRALLVRAMYFVRRILDGANPADLPIEQPTSFEVVVNARTARALGVDLPLALLARADVVLD